MEALGLPFYERAARTNEAIAAIRSLWAAGPSTFEGRFYRWNEMISLPKPVQPGGPPIVVGGHAPAAARRAARLGNGLFWPGRLSGRIHAPGDDDALRTMMSVLHEECGRLGRDPSEIEITVGAGRPTRERLRELEEMGVSRIVVPTPRVSEVRQRLEDVMAEVA